jgi:hypothetical protein
LTQQRWWRGKIRRMTSVRQTLGGEISVSDSESENKQRDRVIARNEARRETVGDIRVSTWAIGAAVVAGVIALGIVLAWLNR